MEQLGGLRRAVSDVGLWLEPERPSHVVMALGLTSEPARLVRAVPDGLNRTARYHELPDEEHKALDGLGEHASEEDHIIIAQHPERPRAVREFFLNPATRLRAHTRRAMC